MSRSDGETYLVFDLGASSGRAILGRVAPDGGIGLEEVHRFPNGPVVAGGGAFWDIERLFEDMLEGCRRASQAGARPRAIGIDTWGVDFALLDGEGCLLEPPRCYRDRRNAGISARVAERIGAERLHARTGSMHQDHASLCQLLAAAENTPKLLAAARRLLFIPDLLRCWLCGDASADVTFASTSQMYDVVAGEWATDILDELDVPGFGRLSRAAAILPRVHRAPAVVGTLSKSVQRATGLPGLPVVTGAGHDTGAAFGACLAALGRGGLPAPEETVVISSGTWAILGVFVGGHLPAGTLDPKLFGYEANPDGSLRIVRNLVGGWLIEQCRKAWGAGGADVSYEALITAARAAAADAKAAAIVDGQWEGFTHPADMPAAIATFCRQSGQPVPETIGQFAQVIFASLADSYAQAIQLLRRRTGRKLEKVYMIGGMSRNAWLNELTSRRAGVKVLVGPAEATALGNVLVTAQAVGQQL